MKIEDVDDDIFARKLERLFDKIRKSDGTQYSNQEVADSLGGGTTPGHIWKLRKGVVKNPKYNMIKALVDFFEVSPGYFFCDDEEEVDPEVLHLAKKLGDDPGAKKIALRATGSLKRETERKIILSMIEAIEKINQEEEIRLQKLEEAQGKAEPNKL
jgi:transcriptional regulator with XRE-family HTH domain